MVDLLLNIGVFSWISRLSDALFRLLS